MKLDINISCCLCSESHEIKVDLPEGWDTRYGGTDVENAFCPKHSAVQAFAESQCPGCVGGWGDCPMWAAFAYSPGRDIEESDFKIIEGGICPRRVNGTLSVNRSARGVIMEKIDLSDRAPTAAGAAFAEAIRDYIKAYP